MLLQKFSERGAGLTTHSLCILFVVMVLGVVGAADPMQLSGYLGKDSMPLWLHTIEFRFHKILSRFFYDYFVIALTKSGQTRCSAAVCGSPLSGYHCGSPLSGYHWRLNSLWSNLCIGWLYYKARWGEAVSPFYRIGLLISTFFQAALLKLPNQNRHFDSSSL